MSKNTKIILLLAISLITLSVGVHKKYLKVYGDITSTNKDGQLVKKGYHLDEWIEMLEDMEKLQQIHSKAFGNNFDSGLKEMQQINYLCYFLFIVSAGTGIAFLSLLFDKGDKENAQKSTEKSD
jgi:hypothetical protein